MIHGGHAGENGDLVFAHRAHGGSGVEVVEQDGARAGREADAQHRVEPEHVEERQHAEADVAGVQREARMVEDLSDVGCQVAVRDHRRLGSAGSPRGEQQHGDVRVVARHAGGRLGVPGAVERRTEHDGGLDRRELAVELGVGCLRVQRYGDRADPQRPEVRRDERDRVVTFDRHLVAGPDALGSERARDTCCARFELAVRDGVGPGS